MPSAAPVSEGFIPFRGFRTWYRVVGDLAQPALTPFTLKQGRSKVSRGHCGGSVPLLLAGKHSSDTLPLDGYAPYKIQTAPCYAVAPYTPGIAGQDMK
jgi:hypothetical protein